MPFGTITSTSNTFGSISGDVGANVPGTLSGSVGVPGPQGPAGSPGSVGPQGPVGPAGQGVPAGGLTNQFLVKASNLDYATAWTTFSLAGYATESWVTSQGYLTSSALTGYATQSFVAANYAPIAAGLPTGGTVGQVLTKQSGSDFDDSWQTLIPGDRYLTSSTTSLLIDNNNKTLTVGTGLSYTTQQDIVIAHDAANHMHARVLTYNSGTGVMTVDVLSHSGAGTYSSWTVNVGGTPALQSIVWGDITGVIENQGDLATALGNKLETSTAASTYAALSGATFSGEVVTPASTTSNAGLTITPGVAPSAPTNGEIWATTTDLQVRLNGVTETIAEQSWVTGQGYITSSALTPYAPLAGATFTGLISTLAPTTATAGLRLPHGTAPTTGLTNGDLWTTTSGLFARINGSTRQYVDFDGTQTINGNKTFSNATLVFGNSTATSTTGLATGATISGSTKTVSIGTGAVAGATTSISIGSTTGSSTTTLNGTTNGVTVAADTNSTALATTAFVVGQAASATPLVDGTAAVGTSLRYARQDHVHPTDTSRAPTASPTFTGTVTIPAGASIAGYATQSFVTSQGYITASALTGYATESFVTSQGYITSSALTGYATESFVTSQGYLTDAPSDGNQYARKDGAWDIVSGGGSSYITSVTSPLSVTSGNLSVDLSNYLTLVDAATAYLSIYDASVTYYPLTNPNNFMTESAATAVFAPKFTPVFTGNVSIISNSANAALFIEQSGAGNIMTLHDQASDTTFVAIDANGKINTIPSVAGGAGFNVPHGAAPTTPLDGDVWSTTGGLFWRQSGGTKQAMNLGDTQTVGGNITFSNANGTFGSSTATGTINIASGATVAAATKTVNVGSGGVTSSTTNVNVGSNAGGNSSINLFGQTTVNGRILCLANATNGPINVGAQASEPTLPGSGDMWYRSAGSVNQIVGFTGTRGAMTAVRAYATVSTMNATPTMNANFNVNSITDNGVGDITLNFINTIADANYAVIGSAGNGTASTTSVIQNTTTARTTAACRILVSAANVAIDPNFVSVAILR